MTPKLRISIPILALFLLVQGCASILPGNDPVVVNAERDTQLAMNTFALIEHVDYDSYAAFKAINPTAAAAMRTFVNNIRRNEYQWLTSARTLTKAYKNNRDAAHKANLDTAMAVLISATAEATKYLTQIKSAQQPHAWIDAHSINVAWLKLQGGK